MAHELSFVRKVVFEALLALEESDRTYAFKLARDTGMNYTTVLGLLSELREKGWIKEVQSEANLEERGHPPRMHILTTVGRAKLKELLENSPTEQIIQPDYTERVLEVLLALPEDEETYVSVIAQCPEREKVVTTILRRLRAIGWVVARRVLVSDNSSQRRIRLSVKLTELGRREAPKLLDKKRKNPRRRH